MRSPPLRFLSAIMMIVVVPLLAFQQRTECFGFSLQQQHPRQRQQHQQQQRLYAVVEEEPIDSSPSSSTYRQQANDLLSKAKALREELVLEQEREPQQRQQQQQQTTTTVAISATPTSPFALPPLPHNQEAGAGTTATTSTQECSYRLDVDIGREPGTWMDRRWAASGRRIEFTVDVRFLSSTTTNENDEAEVSSSSSGHPGSRIIVETAPYARMNGGFEKMKCDGGSYRIEQSGSNNQKVLRFCLQVQGTEQTTSDVSVPEGLLYFSLPVFGGTSQNNSIENLVLSQKSGLPVTVKQMGWNTGWYREESRIVGVFKCTPITDDWSIYLVTRNNLLVK